MNATHTRMNRNLLKQYALKGAKYGAMTSIFVGVPVIGFTSGIYDRSIRSNSAMGAVMAIGSMAVTTYTVIALPIIGAVAGSTFIICKSYGFNDMVMRNRKMIMFPVGLYTLYSLPYYYATRR